MLMKTLLTLLNECADYIRSHPDNDLSDGLLERIRVTLARNDGFAVVSEVSREDITSVGYDASAVDDDTLELIAEYMGESHTECGCYWISLKLACSREKIPRLQSKKQNENLP